MKRKITAILLSLAFLASLSTIIAGATANWVAVSGYDGTASLGSITDSGTTVNFKGYGYGKYVNKIAVAEGTSISFNIQPKTLSATRQYFAVAFLNVENSFFGNATRDTGTGFAVQLRGFGSYTSGCGVYYSPVVGGVYTYNSTLGTADHLIRNVNYNMITTTYYFTMTRKTQTVSSVNYTWEIKYYSSADATVITTLLTDSDVSPSCFMSGLFVTAGVRTGTYEEYNINNLTVTPNTISPTTTKNIIAQVGDTVTQNASDLFTLFNAPGTTYTASVGTITNGVWSYTPNAIGKTTVTITATYGSLTVSNTFTVSAVKNVFSRIRGYETTAGSFTTASGVTELEGYGALKYSYPIPVTEGASISFAVSPQMMLAGINNLFAITLSNVDGSFIGNALDTGSGFALQFRSWGQYTSGTSLYYSTVTSGNYNYAFVDANLVGNYSANMIANTWTVNITKKNQTVSSIDYTWLVTVSSTVNSTVFTKLLTAAEVPDSLFSGGYAYLSLGYRLTGSSYTSGTVKLNISNVKASIDQTKTLVETGDINSDGLIDINDLILCRKFQLAQEASTSLKRALGDMNGDNSLNILDLLNLKDKVISLV